MERRDDIELIQLMTAGNDLAFKMLYDKYYTSLCLFANKILTDEEAAIDVVQDMMVWLYEERATLEIDNVKSFLFRAVHNRCLNVLKHQKVERMYAEKFQFSADEAYDSIDNIINATETTLKINSAIDALPDQCKLIFKRSRFDGDSNDEIATQLGISKRTVETQISKALRRLREVLDKN
ncbi:MAG: RNA polymerase sigma-70 factor [Marinilabiliaceae bacterium]|nr:RNA polymerase sigma-70 factor [Marinilabiliaceae bacterium]